ncbi:EamA family transporter [Tumidithrix elongata RA019]|uniref:EamA family transporter n=1 Tax=Tumidithrix elongata BACA0141 TaxID=2716417 RepID=A0AAW9PP47_9CYAN|nr:EamA family transporter [Tumidithrix elongata RA019]
MDKLNIQNSNYEQTLNGITKDLADLRANLIGRLSREILILQAQKNALTDDIQRLQAQRNELEVQIVSQQGLNQQEIQRQQWIEQLARAIAVHLKADTYTSNSGPLNQYSQNVDRLITNLDSSLRATFQALQSDVDSYQKELDQQMGRMYSQRQQGELMLAALVERLNEQLRSSPSPNSYSNGMNGVNAETAARSDIAEIRTDVKTSVKTNGNGSYSSASSAKLPPIYGNQNLATTVAQPKKLLSDDWWQGFFLVLAASVILSLQNVFVKVVLSPSDIFGAFHFGGLIKPSISSSFMLLFLRMMFATPLMWLVATQVFRVNVKRDIQQALAPNRRPLFWRVVISAVLQFTSFAFIYLAIGLMKPGIAVTLFFIFPTVTVLLAWLLFGDRPTRARWVVIGIVYFGAVLTAKDVLVGVQPNLNPIGILYAVLSGITFAGYIVASQACFKQLNPVSFTTINFSIVLLLCTLTLPFISSSISFDGSLLGMCFLIALTTLSGYLLTSFGTKLMGASQASIVSASGPAFTTFLAFAILADKIQPLQVVGVLIVTLGVALLSLQNLRKRPAR